MAKARKDIPHPFLKEVGENVAKLRKEKEWTMEDLANEVSLTKPQIHRIENGYNITLLTLLKLAIALEVKPEKLLKVTGVYDIAELPVLASSIRKKTKS